MTFTIDPLGAAHDRADFDCGVSALNNYLKTQAGQDIKRKVAACFIATDKDTGRIAGYYTLSAADIPLTDLPDDIAKKLPRYVSIPAARLGRLAIANDIKGRGLGGVLLFDALARAIESDMMAFAMIVDAKDDTAISFYKHHGFIQFADNLNALFLPLSVAEGRIKKR